MLVERKVWAMKALLTSEQARSIISGRAADWNQTAPNDAFCDTQDHRSSQMQRYAEAQNVLGSNPKLLLEHGQPGVALAAACGLPDVGTGVYILGKCLGKIAWYARLAGHGAELAKDIQRVWGCIEAAVIAAGGSFLPDGAPPSEATEMVASCAL